MEKILVTTDFSENSKAAIRFALQLSDQAEFGLVFIHVTELLKPVKWTEEYFSSYEQKELADLEKQLKTLVMEVSGQTGSTIIHPEYVVRNSSSVPASLVHYAQQHSISYICIARKGGGHGLKLFGSIVSTLMEKSNVPVIAVPEHYQPTALQTVCYASDLETVEQELLDVLKFSKPLNASLELVHFIGPASEVTNNSQLIRIETLLTENQVSTHFEPMDIEVPLADKLANLIRSLQPSIMVMFTRQNRNFFERLFSSSISAEVAIDVKIPLLVIRKVD